MTDVAEVETTTEVEEAGETPASGETETVSQEQYKKLQQETITRRREAKELKSKLAELEDAGKSETERREEALKVAEKSVSAKEAKLLRYEAAAAADIPLDMAVRLVGETPEELAADAKKLKKQLGGATPTGGGFDGGARGPGHKPQGMNDWIRQQAGIA